MKYIGKWKFGVRTKLLVGFLVPIAMMITITLVASFQLRAIRTAMAETVNSFSMMDAISAIEVAMTPFNDAATEYALGDVYSPEELSLQFKEADAALSDAHAAWMALASQDPDSVAEMELFHRALTNYHDSANAMITARDQLRAANTEFEVGAANIKSIRYRIKDALLGQGLTELELGVHSLGYHEKEFLYQYRDVPHRQELEADVESLRQAVSSSSLSPRQRTDALAILKEYEDALSKQADIVESIEAANQAVSEAMMSFDGARSELVSILKDAVAAQRQQVAGSEKRQRATVGAATSVVIGGSLLAIVIVLVLALLMTGGISRAVYVVTRAATGIAAGDLAQNVEVKSNDELGEMAAAFTDMIDYFQSVAVAADRLAKGDLTVEIQPRSEQDVLGTSFTQMLENWRNLALQVTVNADDVKLAAENLASAANHAGQATAQIAATIQQVANGANQQAASASRTAESVDEMSQAIERVAWGAQEQSNAVNRLSTITESIAAAIQQVAANARLGAEGAAQVAEAAQAGAATVEANIAGMHNIQDKVGSSAQKVIEMGKRSEQIGVIVETIGDIASQTNLLALNAAIEAARAGEHGQGFAVVADEVRRLAEKSAAATKEIGELVRDIQNAVSEAVVAMNEGAKEVEAGVEQTHRAGDALTVIMCAVDDLTQQMSEMGIATQQMEASSRELVNAIHSVSTVVEENTAITEEMAAGSEQVISAVENIARVSEENSAAAADVSAAAEEMAAQVNEVTLSAQALSTMAEGLHKAVSLFKLDPAATEPVSIADEIVMPDTFPFQLERRTVHHEPAPNNQAVHTNGNSFNS